MAFADVANEPRKHSSAAVKAVRRLDVADDCVQFHQDPVQFIGCWLMQNATDFPEALIENRAVPADLLQDGSGVVHSVQSEVVL